ncbi:MAG TPA: SDR family NAD(P)-dependent oxidoreductase [Thermoanaerobaculia bacterium]|jgi:short-subunit dehydrogenase|nr:SDR family NAD(P)-dependent oxidoreductase [Thermoanaerobaculia bacterium]
MPIVTPCLADIILIMVAIVTGASSGLGLSLAQLLRERGTPVVGVSRRASADVSGDAAKRETALRAIAAAERFGTVDLLVNCAGIGIFGPAGSYDEQTIAAIIDSNLVATINFCEILFPRFKEHGGTIVNILSTAALTVKANESVYCAAKWGARGYSEALKAEAKGTKVRVMTVAPGGMNTPFWPEPRAGFIDPTDVAAVIADAIERPVDISEIVITRR